MSPPSVFAVEKLFISQRGILSLKLPNVILRIVFSNCPAYSVMHLVKGFCFGKTYHEDTALYLASCAGLLETVEFLVKKEVGTDTEINEAEASLKYCKEEQQQQSTYKKFFKTNEFHLFAIFLF